MAEALILYSEVQMSFADFATAEQVAITLTQNRMAAMAHILPECHAVKVRLDTNIPPADSSHSIESYNRISKMFSGVGLDIDWCNIRKCSEVLVLFKTESVLVPRIIAFMARYIPKHVVPITETNIESGNPSFLSWISERVMHDDSGSSQDA